MSLFPEIDVAIESQRLSKEIKRLDKLVTKTMNKMFNISDLVRDKVMEIHNMSFRHWCWEHIKRYKSEPEPPKFGTPEYTAETQTLLKERDELIEQEKSLERQMYSYYYEKQRAENRQRDMNLKNNSYEPKQ